MYNEINYLNIIVITVLIITFDTIAISQEIISDIKDRKNYTANDLISELAKLANAQNTPRQRIPINPNYQYPGYYDDYQQNNQIYQRPGQYPFVRRPINKRPYQYRPDYLYRPQNDPEFNQYQQYQQYPESFDQYQQYPTGPNQYDDGPFSGLSYALGSIARYDDQQCVPRLLCEVAAGTNPGAKQSSFLPNLPNFLSMESLFTLLSAFTGEQVSPFLIFGRAAILGVTSQGNPSSCRYAYPECPRDPDRLVEYLNNHNGGFFRFFGGLQQQQLDQNIQDPNIQQNLNIQQNPNVQQDPNYYNRPYQQQYQRPIIPNRYQYRSQNNSVEAKIQNKPIFAQPIRQSDLYIAQSYFYPNVLKDNAFKFPESPKSDFKELNHLKFPSDDVSHKRPKTLFFSGPSNDLQNDIFLPTPLPFYDHSKMIFPDRTGTGNLIFDSQQLNRDRYVPNYINNNYNPIYNTNGGSSIKYHDNQSQSSTKKYVYIVRGNGDPNHPEIVPLTGRNRNIEENHEKDDKETNNRRDGIPWMFPNVYEGKIYNDRSINIDA